MIINVEVTRCENLGMCKCPRCFIWGYQENYDNLCDRCVDVLLFSYPNHFTVVEILKVRQIQMEECQSGNGNGC